jgi:hypothetical protein
MTRNFLDRFFEKKLEYQISQNPCSGNRVAPCGRKDGRADGLTDRHDEDNSRFSQFCERA